MWHEMDVTTTVGSVEFAAQNLFSSNSFFLQHLMELYVKWSEVDIINIANLLSLKYSVVTVFLSAY